MTRKQAWKKYLKLHAKGDALCSQGLTLRSQGHAFYSQGSALYAEGHALYAPSRELWEKAIAPLTVNKWESWVHCILSNGEEYKS